MPARLSSPFPGKLCVALLLCVAMPVEAAPDLGPPALPLLATRVPTAQQLPSAPVQSVFHIEKSENRNQVHFGARVDHTCRPVGSRPVYAYWRMLERGPRATEALLGHEQPAYGLHSPQVVTRTRLGGRIKVRLRAFPARTLVIEVFRRAGQCAARALSIIHRQPAVLQSIYIDIGFLFSLNYALVRGVRADGRVVQEKLRP